MSSQDERQTELEDQARALLAESVTRIDSRIRSRLNQARQVAVAEVARSGRRPGFWPRFVIMPTAGAVAAAVLVAMVLWQHHPQGQAVGEGGQMAAEDLDLIADGDGLDMVEDSDGSFYEWAVEQGQPAGQAVGETVGEASS